MGDRIELKQYKVDTFTRTTTKVKDLIEALQKCNPEAYVYTEGCDCTGYAVSLDISRVDEVEILRH